MKAVLIVSLAVFGSVLCVNLDRVFYKYAGNDRNMDEVEFSNFWLHFDSNGDGNVTKQEFDTVWRYEDFDHKDRAPFYFLELDRVADELLNDLDFPHIHRLFDENGDGVITNREFRYNWKGLFDD